jgi:hypothetical protein
MKLLLLACILALTMSAQPLVGYPEISGGTDPAVRALGIYLGGASFEESYVVNGSGRSIIGYTIQSPGHSLQNLLMESMLTSDTPGIQPGTAKAVPRSQQGTLSPDSLAITPVPSHGGVLESVIFADGAMVGSDPDGRKFNKFQARLDALRAFGRGSNERNQRSLQGLTNFTAAAFARKATDGAGMRRAANVPRLKRGE